MAGKIIADTIEASGSQISLNVGNVTILTASSTGLTLIPTTNVNVNLTNSIVTLTNGSATSPGLTFSGNTRTGLFMPSANTLAFTAANTESMRIDSSGNVGIGTNSPAAKLDVVGSIAVSGTISGAVVATQANQETATSTTTIVTPGRQQFHPSAAKAWIQCNNNGAIAGSYNVASIADTGAGVVTVTLTTAFSSTSYSVLGSGNGGGGGLFVGAGITNGSVFTLVSFNTVSQSPQDSGIYLGVAFGDQ